MLSGQNHQLMCNARQFDELRMNKSHISKRHLGERP